MRLGLTRPSPALLGLAKPSAFANGDVASATPTRREPGKPNASVGSGRPTTPTRREPRTPSAFENGDGARPGPTRREPRKSSAFESGDGALATPTRSEPRKPREFETRLLLREEAQLLGDLLKPLQGHLLHYLAGCRGERYWPVRGDGCGCLSGLQDWHHHCSLPGLRQDRGAPDVVLVLQESLTAGSIQVAEHLEGNAVGPWSTSPLGPLEGSQQLVHPDGLAAQFLHLGSHPSRMVTRGKTRESSRWWCSRQLGDVPGGKVVSQLFSQVRSLDGEMNSQGQHLVEGAVHHQQAFQQAQGSGPVSRAVDGDANAHPVLVPASACMASADGVDLRNTVQSSGWALCRACQSAHRRTALRARCWTSGTGCPFGVLVTTVAALALSATSCRMSPPPVSCRNSCR
ncbi:hypothetical protein MTO96_037616 [Rhipicephalus appendiculatus]